MLTAFQCEVIAYSTPWGEMFCSTCTTSRLEQEGGAGVEGFEPMIRYSVDEFQGERFAGESPEDIFGDDGHGDECVPEVSCDACGEEIVEAYHYHPDPNWGGRDASNIETHATGDDES